MNPQRRQNNFEAAVRHDKHFRIEEAGAFVKVLYQSLQGWKVWSVMRRMDFDKLLETSLQNEKAEFLNALIMHDTVDVR